MKKRNITLLTAFAAAAALAPTAQAAITGTGNWANPPHTVSGDDWTATANWHALGGGTLTVAGGSQLDMDGYWVSAGWGASPAGDNTLTVTGTGSKFFTTLNVTLGRNVGAGNLIIEEGGWLETTYTDRAIEISQTGTGTVLVTGDGSKLTSINGTIVVGMYNSHPGTLTVEDSGLVQTKSITMGFDGAGEGYIHMGVGGVLAVSGEHTTNPFVSGGLFTTNGSSTGEIQYNPSGDGTTWVNMTGAILDTDYTLTYDATGGPTVNGQDLSGYTVLTMLDTTTPAADPEITSITSLGGGNFELTLKGDPSTSYEFYSSATLDFTSGGDLVPLTAGGTDVTTDGSGDATVQMSLAGSANFVRAQ